MAKNTSIPKTVKKAASGKYLAAAKATDGQWLLFCTHRIQLIAADTGEASLSRSWHEVANGSWNGEEHALQITWVDGTAPTQVQLVDAPKEIPITFREFVDASIVISRTRKLDEGGTLHVAIRKNEKGEMFTQTTVSGTTRPLAFFDSQASAIEAEMREIIGY